jgi:hypothetical protein
MRKIRGLIHVHSKYSYDGSMALPTLKELCVTRGFQFIALTEHIEGLTKTAFMGLIQQCQELSSEEFLLIPGLEVPYENSWHILLLGVYEFDDLSDCQQLISSVRANGGVAILAHPAEVKVKLPLKLIRSLDGVEVWNTKYDGRYVPRPANLHLLKYLQRINQSIYAFAGQDLHSAERIASIAIQLSVSKVVSEEILAQFKEGDFYISSGLVKFNSIAEITFGQKFLLNLISPTYTSMVKIAKTFARKFDGIFPSCPATKMIRRFL